MAYRSRMARSGPEDYAPYLRGLSRVQLDLLAYKYWYGVAHHMVERDGKSYWQNKTPGGRTIARVFSMREVDVRSLVNDAESTIRENIERRSDDDRATTNVA